MPGIETKPNWTEWRYRVKDPNQFQSFRRKTLSRGVTAIIGRMGPGKSAIQALRFSKTVFKTKEEVRTWLKNHPMDQLNRKIN